VLAAIWLAQPAPEAAAPARPHAARPRHAAAEPAPALLVDFLAPPATAGPPPAPAPPSAAPPSAWADPVTPAERAEWSKVNMCEEHGNWHVHGTEFSGGLGISVSNWIAYGGQAEFGPEWAASPDEQIVIAMRMQPYPPDQNGCSAW
jgi:hypothetical protein